MMQFRESVPSSPRTPSISASKEFDEEFVSSSPDPPVQVRDQQARVEMKRRRDMLRNIKIPVVDVFQSRDPMVS